MPVFFAWLGEFFLTRIGGIVLTGLAALGVGWFTSEFAVTPLLSMAKGYFSGLPAEVLPWVSFVGVDRYVTMVLSAYAVAAAGGSLRMKLKSRATAA
ncbi:DUF2523 family protein [Pseudoxanthomonas winnipegensis]|uniref:DUF2523 domain-containing protein n=1 Tax=Pseudoxanthomonas winnipegensis TaxID=2480810 RepID=A0A4Q8MA02_9GAMM|nr:DUF2523 family protein [Pseudoxanthomonas winnipegensis]PZP59143.1 MAG: hypothetical protein DI597_16945 [Pseudoxanthomonas spadix]TAA46279.1 DUF2523 domain-containing protein [Pseudoxanthomonas winnipegensis]